MKTAGSVVQNVDQTPSLSYGLIRHRISRTASQGQARASEVCMASLEGGGAPIEEGWSKDSVREMWSKEPMKPIQLGVVKP